MNINWYFPMPTNITGFSGLNVYLNTLTGDLWWTILTFVLFAVSFLALKKFTTEKALLGASYFTFVIATLLFTQGLIGLPTIIIFFVIVLLANFVQKEREFE